MTQRKPKALDDDSHVPLALFEPPNPNVRPMYAKHLVYQGTVEYSFEELRAARIQARKEEEQKRREKDEMEAMKVSRRGD